MFSFAFDPPSVLVLSSSGESDWVDGISASDSCSTLCDACCCRRFVSRETGDFESEGDETTSIGTAGGAVNRPFHSSIVLTCRDGLLSIGVSPCSESLSAVSWYASSGWCLTSGSYVKLRRLARRLFTSLVLLLLAVADRLR